MEFMTQIIIHTMLLLLFIKNSKIVCLEYKPWKVKWIFDSKIQNEFFKTTTNPAFEHYPNAHRIRIQEYNLIYFSDYYVFFIHANSGQLQSCFTLKNNHNQHVLSGIYKAPFDKKILFYYTLDNSLLCKYFPNEANTTECFKISSSDNLFILHPLIEGYENRILYINGEMLGFINLELKTKNSYIINTEQSLETIHTELEYYDKCVLGLAIYKDYSVKIMNFTFNGEMIVNLWIRSARLDANEDSISFKLKIIDFYPNNIALISKTHYLIYRAKDNKFENIKLKSPNSMLYFNNDGMFAFRSGTKLNDQKVLRIYKGDYDFSLFPPTCHSFESGRVEDIVVTETKNIPEYVTSNINDQYKFEYDYISLGDIVASNITFETETSMCTNTFGIYNKTDLVFRTKKQIFEFDLRELACVMNSDINEIKISASDCANDNSAEWMHFESETLLIENSKMPFVDHRVCIMLLYPVMTNFNTIFNILMKTDKINERETNISLIYIILSIFAIVLCFLAVCVLVTKLFKRYKARSHDIEVKSFELSDNVKPYSFGYKIPPIQQQYRISSVSSSIRRNES